MSKLKLLIKIYEKYIAIVIIILFFLSLSLVLWPVFPILVVCTSFVALFVWSLRVLLK